MNTTTINDDTGVLFDGVLARGQGKNFKIINEFDKPLNISIKFDKDEVKETGNKFHMYTYDILKMTDYAIHTLYDTTDGRFVIIPKQDKENPRTYKVFFANEGETNVEVKLRYSGAAQLIAGLAAIFALAINL